MRRFYPVILFLACFFPCGGAFGQHKEIAPNMDRLVALVNRKSDTAIATADSILKLADKYNDMPSRIKAMTLKGKSLFQHKKNKEAVDLYFEALRLCKSPADDKQIAYLYGELGFAYYSQQHFKESIQYYKKELEIRRRVNGRDSVGNQLINLSVMYHQQKQTDSAFMALNEVAAILTRNNDTRLRGYYYINRGALLEGKGNLDSATYCYLQAYETWKNAGEESQLFKVTFNLGYIEYEKKNYRKALEYYHRSEAAAKKFGMMSEVAHVYGTMAESYAAVNDYKNAYDNLYLYATLSDSLAKADFNSYIAKLDKQFQTEKNRQTIQQQQLELQKQKSRMLLIVLVFIVVLFLAIGIFSYLTFKSRLSKKVEEAKAKFFANVAHEIRTPLSMIQGPVKMLQSKVSDPTLKYHLDIAERNTLRLNDLINQMLTISKIDSDKYQLNESLGNAGAFIEELLVTYRLQAAERNIEFTAQIDTTPSNILFDKDALEKVIGNLLSNAIKYTPNGGAVGIEAVNTASAGTVTLTMNVWDTGRGIAKDEQEKIFGRFYRSAENEKAGTKGIGIGLSLVKDLVSLMHGNITVDSEAGKGSVFTVQLPFKQKTVSNSMANISATGTTILLVEDDNDIRDFNKTILEEKGFNVITATNGNEATAILENHLPDLLITDLMMPGKDGIALLKEIRGNEVTNHLPAIILSARTSFDAKMEGITAGAQVYLPKPFAPDELVALVQNQLQVLEKQRSLYREQAKDTRQTLEERFAGSDPFTLKCYSTIQEHLDDAQLSVERLAEIMNTNRSHFQRKLKALTGYSPSELIRTIRLEKAKELLSKKEGNITEVAYMAGFTSQSYFTKCFSDHFGYPPSQVGKATAAA
jgi:signal transduction histidine kinase/DNA-binding response OmpR family regulator